MASSSFESIEELIGGAGNDILNHSAYGSAVILDLETGQASGVSSFSEFEGFIGSASTSDEIRGLGSRQVCSPSPVRTAGTVDGFTFSSYENLLGRAGDDTFSLVGQRKLERLDQWRRG